MAKLLFNLRQVPDDEADEVRALLDAAGYDWYETQRGFWGVSAGGFWLRDETRLAEARSDLAAYQQRRADLARDAREADLREGRVETTWMAMRRRPLQFVAALLGIALMIAVTLLPFVLLR